MFCLYIFMLFKSVVVKSVWLRIMSMRGKEVKPVCVTFTAYMAGALVFPYTPLLGVIV